MPSRSLPNLGLGSFFDLGEDGWKDTNDLNMLKLSVLTQGGVSEKVAVEPGAPADGTVIVLDETHATQPNDVAVYDDGAWVYFTPSEGWLLYERTADEYLTFDGAVWAVLATGGGGGGGGSPFKGVIAKKAAVQALPAGAWLTVTYGAEEYDTDNFHDTVTNNSRLTIPAGVTRVRLTAYGTAASTGKFYLKFQKNGADFAYGSSIAIESALTDTVAINSPVINVVAGDYFTVQAYSAAGTGVDINADAWFALQVIETTGSSPLSPVQPEAASYTVVPGDIGHYIRLTAAAAKTINIATDATTALPENGEWHFRNAGAGDATVTPVGGVTVNPPAGGTLVIPQNGTATLKRVSADVFDLLGQTT